MAEGPPGIDALNKNMNAVRTVRHAIYVTLVSVSV